MDWKNTCTITTFNTRKTRIDSNRYDGDGEAIGKAAVCIYLDNFICVLDGISFDFYIWDTDVLAGSLIWYTFCNMGISFTINIDAPNVYDLVQFTHRTRKSLLGMDSNYYQSLVELKEYDASDLSFYAQMQITTEQAKTNAQSIPCRCKARLKQREEQIQRALFTNTIKTQNMSGVGQRISCRNFNLDRDSGGLADGLNDPYDARLHKLLVTLYVILSIIAHFVVVFTSDLYQSKETKFEIIGIYSLFQWMICLSFIVTWYQNLRIEYVTALVLQRNLEKGMGTYIPRIGQGGRRSAKGVSFIRGGHGEEKIATEMAEFEKEFRAISPSHYITNSKNSHISNNTNDV